MDRLAKAERLLGLDGFARLLLEATLRNGLSDLLLGNLRQQAQDIVEQSDAVPRHLHAMRDWLVLKIIESDGRGVLHGRAIVGVRERVQRLSDTRPCPQCGRPCPRAARRCLYCGREITPLAGAVEESSGPDSPPPSPKEQVTAEVRRERARSLLDGLGPEARALMPADVLAKLEREAQDPAVTVQTSAAPELSEPSGRPERPQRPQRPELRPLTSEHIAPLEPGGALSGLEPAKPSVAGPASQGAAVLGASVPGVDLGSGGVDEALAYGLSRGGGPFGPRDAPVRLILLPDSRYHSRLADLRDGIHQALGIDKYTVVQALQKEIPSYLASTDDRDTAEALVGPLRRLGARVLLLERQRWLEDARPERVARLTTDDPHHILFERLDGTSFEVTRGAIRWAAVGDIHPDGHRPSVQKRGRSERTERRLGKTEGGYQLLDLMRRGTRRPIRIRSDQFDFSFLGAERELSANLNLRSMLRHLTRDPSNEDLVIPLEESFRRVPHLPGGPIGAPGGLSTPINRRELEFTEYVLLLDARHHF